LQAQQQCSCVVASVLSREQKNGAVVHQNNRPGGLQSRSQVDFFEAAA